MKTCPVRLSSCFARLQFGLALLLLATAQLATPLESRAGSFASSWNSGSGSRATLSGNAEAVSAKIVLTSNSGSEYGRVVIDDLDPGRAVDSFHGCTTLFIGSGPSGADGFSFNFGDPNSIVSDPEGVTNGLAVSLDTYDNGSGDVAGKIAAYYDGSLVVEGPSKNLRTGNFVSLCVVVRSNGEIKIWHDGAGIVGIIGSWTPVAGRRFILAASTGGLADEHTIEDTSIVTHVVGAPPEQFNSTAPQSGWSYFGNARQDDFYLRLTDNAGSQQGSAILEDQNPGQAIDSFAAYFTKYAWNGGGADGIGFRFGDLSDASFNQNVGPSGLTIVWSTYNNDRIRAYYDGNLIAESSPRQLRGQWTYAQVAVDRNGQLVVADTADNTAGALIEVQIPGWAPQAGWRFGFGGSTGGISDDQAIAQISIQTGSCGDGLLDIGEQCDDSGNSCCSATCGFESTEATCGGSGTECTLQDTCDGAGSCVDNGHEVVGANCGDAGDECTIQDSCDGSGTCIDNGYQNVGTNCGDDGSECVIQDTCDGTGSCTDNGVASPGTACGVGGSECILQDTCDASGICITNGFEASGTSCGDASDTQCDNPDTCDGSGTCQVNNADTATACGDPGSACVIQDTCNGAGGCADNGYVSGGTACGDPSDTECTNPDTCDGLGTCQDRHALVGASCGDAGTECTFQDTCDSSGSCTDGGHAIIGTACGDNADTECTDADTCNGSGSCEANHAPPATSCGDSADNECTDPDTCNGSGSCEANHALATTSCGDSADDECTDPDTCDGSGSCEDNHAAAATSCGDSADDECTDPDTCDGAGSCEDNHAAAATSCGDSADNECTDPDTCDGSGSCEENHAAAATSCGDSADDECTDPDTCDGSGSCEANHAAAATSCGDSADDECTDPDTCDGSGSCEANHAAAATSCGEAAGDCDLADTCDGSGACADNGFATAGSSCGNSADTACSNPDTCDDSGNCEANHESDGTTCRGPSGSCDATEVCAGGACPADEDLPDATACDDANPLTSGESCDVGICSCAPGACDFNCGDGLQDATEECDDGGNIDGDGCSAVCTNEAGCGNGVTDSGETCDDGDTNNGDGCSSRCQIEATQSKDQQKCINIVNGLTVKIAQAQGKENLICIKNGGRGKLPENQTITACLTADVKGKVAKAANKLKVAQEGEIDDPSKTKCPEEPNFAYVDDATISTEVTASARDFLSDILGPDADATAVDLTDKTLKKAGVCQQTLIKTADKVLLFQMKEFTACKKAQLKSSENPIISAESLEGCFADVAADAKGKVEKARLKIVDLFGKKCTPFTVGLTDVLDGPCAQNAVDIDGFSSCVVATGRCRTCQIFNAADNLEYDCDTFDDGSSNNSCIASVAGSPSGAFLDGVHAIHF
ncbi:MAG: hypothetical protein P8K07_11285 [Candidatus Binatia bacterium]|nr:hypothetical protein [Candidatus Binatia bacterium]